MIELLTRHNRALTEPGDWVSSPMKCRIESSIRRSRLYLLGVGAGYMFTNYSLGLETSRNGLTYNSNAGLAYVINRNVSIDAVANYTSQPNQAVNGSTSGSESRLNFLLRFQVFLGK